MTNQPEQTPPPKPTAAEFFGALSVFLNAVGVILVSLLGIVFFGGLGVLMIYAYFSS